MEVDTTEAGTGTKIVEVVAGEEGEAGEEIGVGEETEVGEENIVGSSTGMTEIGTGTEKETGAETETGTGTGKGNGAMEVGINQAHQAPTRDTTLIIRDLNMTATDL